MYMNVDVFDNIEHNCLSLSNLKQNSNFEKNLINK